MKPGLNTRWIPRRGNHGLRTAARLLTSHELVGIQMSKNGENSMRAITMLLVVLVSGLLPETPAASQDVLQIALAAEAETERLQRLSAPTASSATPDGKAFSPDASDSAKPAAMPASAAGPASTLPPRSAAATPTRPLAGIGPVSFGSSGAGATAGGGLAHLMTAGDMIGFSRDLGDGVQAITIINASQRWMAVYHIDTSGQIRLTSSRPLEADFTIQFNASSPLPEEIRRLQGK